MTATVVILALGLWMIVAFGLSLLLGRSFRYCRRWDDAAIEIVVKQSDLAA